MDGMRDELEAMKYRKDATALANSIAPPRSIEEAAANEMKALDLHVKQEEMREAMPKAIGVEEIKKASEILRKYKEGKTNLENKIVHDEEYWKLRQWDKKYKEGEDYKPATAWLWSCIQSRYSDAMDSYPTCNFLARQQDDVDEAKRLSAIVPVVLEQNRYEETYSDIVWYILKHGGCVQGVFWNPSKHNGLGDIEIKKVDYLNLFWESGITNIQDSENLFCVELVNKKIIEQKYPETIGHLDSDTVNPSKYLYDDKVDTTDKAVVIDWYYHKWVKGKKTLQYVKYVNDVVLYATENDTEEPTTKGVDPQTKLPIIVPTGEPSIAERGLYDHGQYPFINQPLYPIEGSLCGYGLTDIGKDAQMQIDVLNKAITENAVVNSSPRYFSKTNTGINEEEFLDINKPIVHFEGTIEDNLQKIDANQLNGIYTEVLNAKIEELKYITSNQDVGNGVAPSGITAASAIAALQETQGKNARSSNKALYRAFREVCYQVVELMRQFYKFPRMFRIAPDVMDDNQEQFVSFDNTRLQPQEQLDMYGNNLGFRKPEFDIEITAEKASPYKKMEQNELAIQFFQLGFYNPQMSDQALACLKMMDFSHKEDVINTIQTNGTLYDQLLYYQQIALQYAMQTGDPVQINNLAQAIEMTNQQLMPQGLDGEQKGVLSTPDTQEGTHMLKARNQARESTQVE